MKQLDPRSRWISDIFEAIRRTGTRRQIPAAARIPCAVKVFAPNSRTACDHNESLFHRFARLESPHASDDFSKCVVPAFITEGTFGISLVDVIGVA